MLVNLSERCCSLQNVMLGGTIQYQGGPGLHW